MEALLKKFERVIVITLIGLMMLVIVVATAELAFILVQEILAPPIGLFDSTSLFEIFGFFFMILIGLELLETVRVYLTGDHIHVEIVFVVALIAVARKVIILEIQALPAHVIYGLPMLILALGTAYYLIRKSHQQAEPPAPGRSDP